MAQTFLVMDRDGDLHDKPLNREITDYIVIHVYSSISDKERAYILLQDLESLLEQDLTGNIVEDRTELEEKVKAKKGRGGNKPPQKRL